jgi:hypothetical protein
VNLVTVEKSTGNPYREPSVGNRSHDLARRARSEAASLVSGDCCLADNVTRWQITQNGYMWETYRGRDNLCNVIEDWRHIRARSPMGSAISRPWRRSMKKPKTVANLLTVADVYIEASEAQARLLESHSKGPSKKK